MKKASVLKIPIIFPFKGTYSRLKFWISHMHKINIQIASTRLLTERPRWNFTLSDTYKKFERGIPQNLKWCGVPDNMQMRQPNLICCIYMNYRACNTFFFLTPYNMCPRNSVRRYSKSQSSQILLYLVFYFISDIGKLLCHLTVWREHKAFSRVKKCSWNFIITVCSLSETCQ